MKTSGLVRMTHRIICGAIYRFELSATTGSRLHSYVPGFIAPNSLTDKDNERKGYGIVFGDTVPMEAINGISFLCYCNKFLGVSWRY